MTSTIYKKRTIPGETVMFMVELENNRCRIHRSDNLDPFYSIIVTENHPVIITISGDVEVTRGEWIKVLPSY